MSRSLIAFFILAAALALAQPGDTSNNRALWDELGLVSATKTSHGPYQLQEWHFRDSTGALAASLAIPGGVLSGNYVLVCEGKCPAEVAPLAVTLPGYANQPLPVLRTYLPPKNLAAHSSRYVIGPVGLTQSAPDIPASAAAFQFGTEAIIGNYGPAKTPATLAIFNYPTPQIARSQAPQFQALPGALVKRSGPLVAVVLHAPDPAKASQLLSDVEYSASISWDEKPPLIIRPQTAAQIVLGGIELAGVILVFCLLSGLAYAGIRVVRQRFGNQDAQEPMIVLGLRGK